MNKPLFFEVVLLADQSYIFFERVEVTLHQAILQIDNLHFEDDIIQTVVGEPVFWVFFGNDFEELVLLRLVQHSGELQGTVDVRCVRSDCQQKLKGKGLDLHSGRGIGSKN